MDTLDRILLTLYFTHARVMRWDLRAPWGIAVKRTDAVQFHAVRSGRCWVRPQGHTPLLVEAGDIFMVPDGTPCDYLHAAGTPSVDAKKLLADRMPGQMCMQPFPGNGALTEMVCGYFSVGILRHHPLLRALPSFMLLKAKDNASLMPILELAAREAQGKPCPASATLLCHLGGILLVESVRTYLQTLPRGQGGYWRAMADPPIAAALNALHAEPARRWALQDFQKIAALSHAALTDRFRNVVGSTIGDYLRRLRMYQAAVLLEDHRFSLGQVAEHVGYASESAFCRTFHRVIGTTPGVFRAKSTKAQRFEQ